MAEELLERVLREIRERKLLARAAVDESARLERALAALDQDPPRGVQARETTSRRSLRPTQRGKRAARGANRDAILTLVAERPGVTAAEVAGATGIARSTVSPALARLASSGAVERVELPGGGVGFRARTDAAPAAVGESEQTAPPASASRGVRVERG
jgi:CRP-like cAMP-binding protein